MIIRTEYKQKYLCSRKKTVILIFILLLIFSGIVVSNLLVKTNAQWEWIIKPGLYKNIAFLDGDLFKFHKNDKEVYEGDILKCQWKEWGTGELKKIEYGVAYMDEENFSPFVYVPNKGNFNLLYYLKDNTLEIEIVDNSLTNEEWEIDKDERYIKNLTRRNNGI